MEHKLSDPGTHARVRLPVKYCDTVGQLFGQWLMCQDGPHTEGLLKHGLGPQAFCSSLLLESHAAHQPINTACKITTSWHK